MMKTLQELKAQIAELEKQAEEIRNREKLDVIKDIKEKIGLYQITARELGFVPAPETSQKRGRGSAKTKAEAKYRDEHGNVWSGGKGRRPIWVNEIIESGGDIEKYRIAN